MKRSMIRFMTLLVAIAMLASVAACGGGATTPEATQAGATTSAASETQAAAATEAAKPEPFTFDLYVNYNWWTFDYPFDGSDPLTKWIIDNKGVTMNIKKPTGDEREMMNLMIAADTLPEAILMDKDDIWKKMIALGKLVSIDEYLAKYPGYKNAVSDDARSMTSVDGKNWGLLSCAFSKDWLGYGNFPVINEKIYEQMGKPKLDTYDDLLAYLDAVKKADIKVDGKPVIPLQFVAGTTSGADGNQFWSGWGEGRVNEEYYDFTTRPISGDKIDLTLKDPKFKDNILLAQKLYSSGYVNKDAFVERPEQVKEKMNVGRVAVYVGYNSSDYGRDANAALKNAGSDVTYTGIPPFIAAGVDRATLKTNGKSSLGWNIICISKKAKDPERIYQYLDWISSDEGQILTMFGPKGVIWDELDADGYPVILPGKQWTKSKELPIFDFQLPLMGTFNDKAKMKVNQALPPDQQDYGTTQQVKLEAWKLTKDTTQFEFIRPVAGTAEGQIYNDGNEFIRQQLVKMVVAKTPQESEKLLQQTIDELAKRDYGKVIDFINEKWQINKVKMGIN